MNFKKLTEFLDSMPSHLIPGFDCTVFKGHECIYRHSGGYADAENKIKISSDTLYYLYSCTKVITVVGAMKLVEDGKLILDAPVYDYLPEYRNVTVRGSDGNILPAKNTMTVRHLFTMSSGLNYDLATPNMKKAAEDKSATTNAIMRARAADPLIFEPGTRYSYSLSHDLLAAVSEVAAGKTFGEYLDEVMFSPLGMKDTGFRLTDAKRARLAMQYSTDATRGISLPVGTSNQYILSENFESGGAGLHSTVDDYSKFASTLASGGISANGYRLISSETLDRLRTNELEPQRMRYYDHEPKKKGYGYGLGVRTLLDPTAAGTLCPAGEYGWDGAAGAYVLVEPSSGISIFYAQHVLNCSYSAEIVHQKLRDLVYECLAEN